MSKTEIRRKTGVEKERKEEEERERERERERKTEICQRKSEKDEL